MKTLFLILALLLTSVAQAETVTLNPERCTPGLCFRVPNSAGLTIASIQWGPFWLTYSDGQTIYGSSEAMPVTITVPGPNKTTITTIRYEDVVLIPEYGPGTGTATLSVILTETGYPCTRRCYATVTLDGGTVAIN